jgi:hypothetical protein
MHDASEVRYAGPSLMVQVARSLKMSFLARWDVIYWGLAVIKAVHVFDMYYTVYPCDVRGWMGSMALVPGCHSEISRGLTKCSGVQALLSVNVELVLLALAVCFKILTASCCSASDTSIIEIPGCAAGAERDLQLSPPGRVWDSAAWSN